VGKDQPSSQQDSAYSGRILLENPLLPPPPSGRTGRPGGRQPQPTPKHDPRRGAGSPPGGL